MCQTRYTKKFDDGSCSQWSAYIIGNHRSIDSFDKCIWLCSNEQQCVDFQYNPVRKMCQTFKASCSKTYAADWTMYTLTKRCGKKIFRKIKSLIMFYFVGCFPLPSLIVFHFECFSFCFSVILLA